MFKINNWKEPIYKDDLKSVLINGLIAAVLGGLLAGLIDYFFVRVLSFSVTFGLILLLYFVSSRIRKSFYTYHIFYPVFSLICLFIGLVFSEFAYYACIYQNLEVFKIFITGKFYLNIILDPVYNIIVFFKSFNFLHLIMGILNLVIYIYVFFTCYKIVKGRN